LLPDSYFRERFVALQLATFATKSATNGTHVSLLNRPKNVEALSTDNPGDDWARIAG
jgi:hypothetical protein